MHAGGLKTESSEGTENKAWSLARACEPHESQDENINVYVVGVSSKMQREVCRIDGPRNLRGPRRMAQV